MRHSVQSPAAKIFRFPSIYPKRNYPPSTPPKGRIAIFTDAELEAMDGSISQASGIDTCGQAVWFRSPDAGIKSAEEIP
jgi:hypothetical protein